MILKLNMSKVTSNDCYQCLHESHYNCKEKNFTTGKPCQCWIRNGKDYHTSRIDGIDAAINQMADLIERKLEGGYDFNYLKAIFPSYMEDRIVNAPENEQKYWVQIWGVWSKRVMIETLNEIEEKLNVEGRTNPSAI